MPRQVLLFSGASAMGKTSVLKSLLLLLAHGGMAPCVCKIDCLKTGDADVFQSLGLPCVTGLSGISALTISLSLICRSCGVGGPPGADALVIETAGLCHRCSPGYGSTWPLAVCWTAPPAAGRRGSWVPCSPRRTLWCSPRSTWCPRRSWRSSPGRSASSTRPRHCSQWTGWPVTARICWHSGCWPGRYAPVSRGRPPTHHAQRRMLLLRGRAAGGQRVPAGRGGQNFL